MRIFFTLSMLACTLTLASCQMFNQLINSTSAEASIVEAAKPPTPVVDTDAGMPVDWPVSGHFEVVALRRAGDVAGGPEDLSDVPPMGARAEFGHAVSWRGEPCPDPSFEHAEMPLANYADPILSDLAFGGNAPEASWTLRCAGVSRARFDQIDTRILVTMSPSGQTYSIFEQALEPADIEKIQAQLAMTGHLQGTPQNEWNPEAIGALSKFAHVEGAAFAFHRPVITEALITRLAIAASPERIRFPDYTPKTSPDKILDYRPALAGEIDALPLRDPENLGELVIQLEAWSEQARDNPGQFVPGNMPLGANTREYEPSDAELIAFEVGTRLAHALSIASGEDIIGVSGKESLTRLSYPSFTFRHVDVMGSGRFTYASAPEWLAIEAHE